MDNAGSGCPECGGSSILTAADGSRYCEDCGHILADDPIERSEPGWRDPEERRTAPASSVSRESVGTIVRGDEGDRSARILAHHNNRLDYSTRALKDGLREVRGLCAAAGLSKPTEARAAYLYRRATRMGLLQGRSREGIAAACVYIAARRYNQPVTLSDIASVSPISKERISSAYRTVLQEFDLGLQPPEPEEFLPKVATAAGVSFRTQQRAREILETVAETGSHIGQSPSGVAAAALYAAAAEGGEDITQETVAEAAGVSTVTVSRQYQTLKEVLNESE
jgi:transcription initiation factor TFIIB